MSSIGTNLLLLHGHIHAPELVRHLGNRSSTPRPNLQGGKRQRTHSPLVALRSLYARLCLGIGDGRGRIR